MVKLDLLDPWEVYKTRPPIIMPEAFQKKGMAYMVLAPTAEQGLSYLSSTTILKFRYLYNYFIPKKWDHTFHGAGRKVVQLNQDGDYTRMLETYRKGNLKNIKTITSYLPTSKSRPMKDLNVLVGCSHVPEYIMKNEKDRRLPAVKAREIVNELIKVSESRAYLGEYKANLIIPLQLWMTKEELKTPTQTFKRTSKNIMSHILSILSNKEVLDMFHRVWLIYDNMVLLATPNIPEDAKEGYILEMFSKFMIKSSRLKTISMEINEEEPDEEDVKAETKLAKAEEQTQVEITTDEVIEKAGADPTSISDDTRKVLEKKVKETVKPVTKVKSEQVEDDPAEPNTTPIDVKPMKEDEASELGDDVVAAKLEGKSIASYKRDKVLREKYKELKIDNEPLQDILEKEKDQSIPETPVAVDTVNPELTKIRGARFDEAYNKSLLTEDLTNILLHFSHANPALYLAKDIKVEDISSPTDRILRYTVTFEDESRKRHTFSFKLPKLYQDNYLFLNGQKMNLIYQKFPYPVTKVSPILCQAVTNYKKIFTDRYGANLSPRITKLRKIFSSPDCPHCIKVHKGNAEKLNQAHLTTVEYDDIGSSILRLDIGNTKEVDHLYFVVDNASAIIDMSQFRQLEKNGELLNGDTFDDLLPLGCYRNSVWKDRRADFSYAISSKTNLVYCDDKATKDHCCGELSELIIKICDKYDKKFAEQMKDVSAGIKFVYSRSRVMKKFVPTVLVCGAADPNGLTAVLQKSKINYEFVEKRPTVDKDVKGVIPFSDGYLVYDRYPFENSLLLNGLTTFPTKEYSFYDMDNRDTYVDIFDDMFGSRTLIDGLQNFYYMFIDPITLDVLTKLKMPTDFTSLMLYCNDILADNTFQVDSDYHNTRLRSNEIIMAYLYQELADAWGYYRIGKTDKFSIREDAVIKDLLTANIVDPHSELNVILEMENDRQVKMKGPSGMNEDHSFTLEKRAYHPSMQGIVGMNSTPSGEVGITRHLSLNTNIKDARGFIQIGQGDEYDGTQLTTPGELMQAFGPESADIERVAMSISQSKHDVPVEVANSSPVSYDMERVVPYLSKDYSRVAKKAGKVVANENQLLIVQYNDGTYEDVDLSERPAKNTDGGFYIMNQMQTTLKPGDRVKEGQLLAYDPKYMNNHDMFGDTLASLGTLARIAIETNGGVFEDSCYITDDLAHLMATKITRQKRVILSRYANVKYIAKIGQQIQANDPLLTFDDTNDEFTSQMLASMAEEAEDDDEVLATSAPVISKISGTIKDIQITYTADPSDMTPSLQKILENYNKESRKRENTIKKYMPLYDANTIVKTSDKLIPDSTGKVRGVKLDGVMIDFYIEYEDIMAPGDKLSYYSALKGIVSNVIPTELAPYTENNPDRKIQACLSAIGVYKRMVLDALKVGIMNKIVIERKRQLRDKYADRIKQELKKK